MIELYKYLYGLSANIMKKFFTKRILKYNLWNCRVTLFQNPKTKKHGTDTVALKLPNFGIRHQQGVKIYHR